MKVMNSPKTEEILIDLDDEDSILIYRQDGEVRVCILEDGVRTDFILGKKGWFAQGLQK